MGSETPLQLPTIDFCKAELRPGTLEWEMVKSQLWKAISEYGCFKVLFDKIPVDLQKSFLRELEEAFELPVQTKKRFVSETYFHGYVGERLASKQLTESFGVEDPQIFKNCENMAISLWPQGNPNFSQTMYFFAKQVSELEKMIKRMILESLSLEKYLDEHTNTTGYILRLIKYGGPRTKESAPIAIRPHTDNGLITILYQNQVDGLEIQTKDGEWIAAELSPDNSFIVFTGVSFNAWTNGRLRPARHQVRMTANNARYTVGIFTTFKAGYLMKTPEELIDEEHPLLFKPFDYGEFLEFLRTWSPKTPEECGLRAYCGV